MQSTFFWKNWARDYRWLLYALSGLFIFSIALVWIYYFKDAGNVIEWNKIQEQKIIETNIHTFRLGPFQLSVPAESYVIFEYLAGSDLQHNLLASRIFLLILSFSAVILLSLITTLERFWYFVGMSLFILFVISLRLDVLRLFNLGGYSVSMAVLILFLIPAFYFKYFRTRTSFMLRCAVFLVLTILVSLVIALATPVKYPVMHLVVTAYIPALIMSILFIIMVAHEILISFVNITDEGKAGNNVKHFSIISFIYLVYVIITCLHELGGIQWNFIYMDLFLLISISAILGIWGFKIREPQYENILPFAPLGAFFYLALGSICFITIAQFLGNANDSALQVIRYVIIFTHCGFGIIFLIYFFSNFLVMMGNNIRVYNLLYKPNRMPYFTFRFAGIIASLAFLFYSDWRDFVSHGASGLYNYVGDMHLLEGDEAYALTFYEQSKSRSFQNHRANYELAMLKTSRLNLDGAKNNYKLANGKRPTAFSLVNSGNLELWTGSYFDAIATFKEGEKAKPNSYALKNNLGYAYAKVHSLDSASYYMTAARNDDLTKSSSETNFLAMAAAELIPINTDSVLKFFESKSPAVISNAVALSTLFNQELNIEKDPLEAKRLNLYTATFLNNYINRNAKTLDTVFLNEAYKIASDSLNFEYSEALQASLAHAYYHQGNVYKALAILGELAYRTQNYQGKFNYIMGLWTLEQGAPSRAASYFTFAEMSDYKKAKFYYAISLTEAGQTNEAIAAWDSLLVSEDQEMRVYAEQLKRILQTPTAKAIELPDLEKYQFCRYRIPLKDTVLLKKITNTFSDDNFKASVLFEAANKFYKAGRIPTAIQFINQLNGLEISDHSLYNNIRHLELLLFAAKGDLTNLNAQINKDITFGQQHMLHKILFDALISEQKKDLTTATKNYKILARSNPFFDEGILAAATFFRNQDPKSQEAYNTLVDAIYINANSSRLLKAYAAEAARLGYDDYASSAIQRMEALENAIR